MINVFKMSNIAICALVNLLLCPKSVFGNSNNDLLSNTANSIVIDEYIFYPENSKKIETGQVKFVHNMKGFYHILHFLLFLIISS